MKTSYKLTTYKELIMSKILLFLSISSLLFAVEIPIKKAEKHLFGKEIQLNAKVIQLSNAKQAIMAQVSGHIERYFVKPNQQIKTGQKIALLQSTKLSELTAQYIATKRQNYALLKTYQANKDLYKKGLISAQELSTQEVQKDAMFSKLSTLKSKLQTLEIDTKNLKKASSDYILYAHSDGVVSKLLQPLHAVVDKEEKLISIVKEQAFYIESYLPLKYIQKVKIGDKLVAKSGDESIITKINQILPNIDEKSQRVVLLSQVTQKTNSLFIGAYLDATLYSSQTKEFVAVEKSALSFFNNEWVVFVPKEEEHQDLELKHDEHDEEVPYEAKVVEVLAEDEKYVAIKGLKEDEAYISDKGYFIKSMLLKSSLGGHGH